MEHVLHKFQMNPTTWVYLASVLIVVVFFKFRRLFSVRNLDLLALMAFSPGLLLVAEGQKQAAAAAAAGLTGPSPLEAWGFVWLMAASGFLLVRLLWDPLMVRRPLLEPNLTADALACLAVVLLAFMVANVLTAELPDTAGKTAAAQAPQPGTPGPAATETPGSETQPNGATFPQTPRGEKPRAAPRFWLLDELPRIPSQAFTFQNRPPGRQVLDFAARILLIVSHLAVVLGLVFVGYRHFDNIWTGIATATLYLLLPYTAQMVGDVVHVVPAALLVWAIAMYRRPIVAGVLLGVAIGMIPPYPAFLLPLWVAFYWQRGLLRFVGGVAATVVALTIVSKLYSPEWLFIQQIQLMFSLPDRNLVEGFWKTNPQYIRVIVVAVFLVLCFALSIWPAQKNLGTLIGCSAAVMLATQFWYPEGGLLYMNWYLPLLLLTVFRPNLENRVALAALREVRLMKRRNGQMAA